MSSLFPWRMPLDADWLAQVAEIERILNDGGTPDYAMTKRAANQQLGLRELLRTERLAARLGQLEGTSFARFKLGLLGSRNLGYLSAPLRAAGLARGLLVSPCEAPYDRIASFAFSANNCFEGPLDAVLVILDEGAFQHSGLLLDAAAEDQVVAAAEELVLAIAKAARSKTTCPAIIATLPSLFSVSSVETATPGSMARLKSRVNMMIANGAMRGAWLMWDQAALAARIGLERWFDPIAYHVAKVPFSINVCPQAADKIAALLAAMKGNAARALVLDLDNTLWGGVIGDDGIAGIRLGQNSAEGEAFVAFQRFVLHLRERGIVLAVCSKNTDGVARGPFRNHPEMVLKEQHIAVFQANWNDKATNIRSIAEKLDLGLESIAYIDDNPAERERVRQELPLVSTVEVGEDPSFFIQRVVDSGLFDHIPLNSDDLARAQSYGGRAAVAEIRAKLGNYDEYLASLQMRITIAPFDAAVRPRIVQLINKSNQFNLTTRRYNDEEVRCMQADADLIGWQVRLDDKFAQYGMISVVIVRRRNPDWEIDTWLQSCRVLERGVEHCVMNTLFKAAAAAGIANIRGRYIPSERNAMVLGFYPRMGFATVGKQDDGSVEYICAVESYQPHPVFVDVCLVAT